MNIRQTLPFLVAAVMAVCISRTAISQTLYRDYSGTDQRLNALFFVSDSIGFAVGDSGILTFTTDEGINWQVDPLLVDVKDSPFVGNLNTIYFSDPANGAFAGDSGAIFVILQDNNPTPLKLPESKPIYAMTFPSYDTGIVAGGSGLFYRTIDSGKNWTKIKLPALAETKDYHGIDYFDNDTYWLVGQSGVVLYTEDGGKNWRGIEVPTTNDLYSISFPDASGTGWIVGDQTLLLTTDGGDNWTNTGTTADLRFVSGWDSTHAYAVGLNGVILHTSDRNNWTSIASGTKADLYGLDFPDSLYFVGDSGLILTTQADKADFLVTDSYFDDSISFGKVLDNTDSVSTDIMVYNSSFLPVTITNIQSGNPAFFVNKSNDNAIPFTVPPLDDHPISITFRPPLSPNYKDYVTSLRVYSAEFGYRQVILEGVGVPQPAGVFEPNATDETNILLKSGHRLAYINYPYGWTGSVRIEVFNILGNSVFTSEILSNLGRNEMLAELPSGVYFYRLSGSGGSCTGKFVLN